MAVEERCARVIGDKIHVDRAEPRDDDRVLHHPGRRPAIHAHDLEEVPMQVHGVRIVTEIGAPVASAYSTTMPIPS